MDNKYRIIVKEYQPFDNWYPVELFFFQWLNGDNWYTLDVSNHLADIRHACFQGNNPEQKQQAYADFVSHK